MEIFPERFFELREMSQKAIGGKSMSEESGRFGDGAKVDDSDNLQWSC